MKKTFNIIFGLLLGLAPVGGFAIIGIAIYAFLPNTKGFLIIGSLGILSLWIGSRIFKRVQIVGPLEFISGVGSSPELDNLIIENDDETKMRQPSELVNLINQNEQFCKGGTIRIYGDWFGGPDKYALIIDSAQFDQNSNTLFISFKEEIQLEIYNPKTIFDSKTFLKIVNAERIKLIGSKDKINYFLDYKSTGKKIETTTNIDWYKPNFDVSLGEPALMFFV